jgi:molybdopterin molybdotransferase
MITYQEALQIVLSQSKNWGTESLALEDSLGRVLDEQIYADRDYPPFNRSAMDGIAINLKDWNEGIRTFYIVEQILAGQKSQFKLDKGQCYKIMTGAAVPQSADCVIRIEDLKLEKNNAEIIKEINVKQFQNIAKQGEDYKKGDKILTVNQHIINPPLVSLLASLGKSQVKVKKTPSVTIISTGDEIKGIESSIDSFSIRDSNSYALIAFFQQYKITGINKMAVKDEKKQMYEAIKNGLKSQILVISGGVSAGEADYVPEILKELGTTQLFHKVQLKPGKPIWFGKNGETIVFALPGNPFSVQVGFKIFIEPFLRKSFGLDTNTDFLLPMSTERIKKVSFDEFFPIKITLNGCAEIEPVKFNGSGDISASFKADGIGFQPASTEKLLKGEITSFKFW